MSVRHLDIHRLLAFIAICEDGSLSAAARRLGIAQPALTVLVKKLESALATPLLVRDTRGVTPTDAGQHLLARAHEIVALTETTYHEIRDRNNEPTGEVSIGLPASIATVLAVPLINAMAKRYKGVRLRLVEMFSGYLWQLIEDGDLDLAVIFDQPSTPEVEVITFADERLYLVGHPEGLPAKRIVKASDIGNYPLAMPSARQMLRVVAQDHAVRHGATLQVSIELDAGQQLIRLIETGSLFSILAQCAVAQEIKAGLLSTCEIQPPLTRSVGLARRRSRAGNNAVQAAVSTLFEQFRELTQRGDWQATLR